MQPKGFKEEDPKVQAIIEFVKQLLPAIESDSVQEKVTETLDAEERRIVPTKLTMLSQPRYLTHNKN